MPDQKADLILHPVRMRILMAIAGKQMTAQQLAAALPDVAQATLYRHINRLANGGALTIVEEHPVRGTMEKVYALDQVGAWLGAADIANFNKDDHMRYFTAFIASVLGDFAKYLASTEKPDLVADSVSYSKLPVYLSDDELRELGEKMREVVLPVLNNQPIPGRKRRIIASILMPASDEPPNNG